MCEKAVFVNIFFERSQSDPRSCFDSYKIRWFRKCNGNPLSLPLNPETSQSSQKLNLSKPQKFCAISSSNHAEWGSAD